MKPETNADYGEQVRDDVLAAVRRAFAAAGRATCPTVTMLAASLPYESEEIEEALLVLADVDEVELGRSGGGVLRVVQVRAPG